MNKYGIALLMLVSFLFACSSGTGNKNETKVDSLGNSAATNKKSANGLAAILSKKQVPVLCYHHIRDAKPRDSENMKSYSVSPSSFAAQMKALSDSGYSAVLPDQLYDYLVNNVELPAKPVMITFDDTDGEQFSIGATEMQKYGFKGVFFIMTVAINRPRYMTKEQIKNLKKKHGCNGSLKKDDENPEIMTIQLQGDHIDNICTYFNEIGINDIIIKGD